MKEILPVYLDNLLYKTWCINRSYWQQFTHTKPIYDPFEVFNPSKAFLKEVIKQLKQQCYEIIKEKENIKKTENCPDWLKESIIEQLNKQHKKLVSRIQNYGFRISGNTVSSRFNSNSIGQDVKERAKQRPISDVFVGKLTRSNNRLLGKCPFHDDRKASFVIYTDQNSWWCFACNIGGDVIAFIMKLNNLNFIEAVKYLL